MTIHSMDVQAQAGFRARRPIVSALKGTLAGYRRWLGAERACRVGAHAGAGAPQDSRHALIVATSLPPRFDGGVFRPLSWLKYASENGWRISAVTPALDEPAPEGGLELQSAIPSSALICRTREPADAPSPRFFPDVDGGLMTSLALFESAAEIFAPQPPTVVVGTAPRFSGFIAAYFLSRFFGANLVLDYRDEWSENPFPFVQAGRSDKWWERRCLAAADAVVFTTEGQLRHNDAAFPGLIGKKGLVLRNGWEPDESVALAATEARRDGAFEIAFSGVLGTMAPPGAFLSDLAAVLDAKPELRGKLRLRFIGRRLPEAEAQLHGFRYPEILDLAGPRPRREADALIRRSDALLIMCDEPMARYMPGKMFEYIAAEKPVLVHGRPGEVQELVDRLGAGLFVPAGDPHFLARALSRIMTTPAEEWRTARRTDWAERHTRREMARAFFALLGRLGTKP